MVCICPRASVMRLLNYLIAITEMRVTNIYVVMHDGC